MQVLVEHLAGVVGQRDLLLALERLGSRIGLVVAGAVAGIAHQADQVRLGNGDLLAQVGDVGLDLGALWRSDTGDLIPASAALAWWLVALAVLLVVHLGATPEWWSLAGFYRGKLRLAYATYRERPPGGREVLRTYKNDDEIDSDAVKTLPGTGGPDDVGEIEVDPSELNLSGDSIPGHPKPE